MLLSFTLFLRNLEYCFFGFLAELHGPTHNISRSMAIDWLIMVFVLLSQESKICSIFQAIFFLSLQLSAVCHIALGAWITNHQESFQDEQLVPFHKLVHQINLLLKSSCFAKFKDSGQEKELMMWNVLFLWSKRLYCCD